MFPLSIIRDPDIGRSTPQFIRSRGFICETHDVVTQDGYILTLFRIVNPRFMGSRLKRPTVLHHGLMMWSNDWINNSPGGNFNEPYGEGIPVGNNLGFELAKRGYDVWLPNTRGNAYSRNHTTLPTDSWLYWNFSLDEMIFYDVPAVVAYIRKTTRRNKIAWIGHSQGNTIMLGLMSLRPEYSSVIEPFILVSPSYTLVINGIPPAVLCQNILIPQVMYNLGGKFLPDDILRPIAQRVCSVYYPGTELCRQVIFFIAGGYLTGQLNISRVPVYLGYDSYGESIKNLAHRCQHMTNGGRFNMFDYLEAGNLKKYGTPVPPEYPVSRITSRHMVFITSRADRISDPLDVQLLRNRLTVPLREDYVVPKDFSHVDYLWGMETGEMVNKKIIQVLSRYES